MRTYLFFLLLCFPLFAVPKVVFVAGKDSHGPGAHEFTQGSYLLAKYLNESKLVEATVVYEENYPQTHQIFEKAQAIIFYGDGYHKHLLNQKGRFEYFDKLAKKGVGIGALHYACEIFKERGSYYLDWIGGYYERGLSTNPHWELNSLLDEHHPITRGVQPFQVNDEWYFNMRFTDQKGLTHVLKGVPPEAARARSKIKQIIDHAGKAETVLWAFERPKGGRGFGFTGGHFHHNWAHDEFRKIVLNAILWSAKVEVPQDGLNTTTPSKEQMAFRPEINMTYPVNKTVVTKVKMPEENSVKLVAETAVQAPKVELDVYDGLEARLFAKEPMVHAPTQVEVDHLGRVWVCEGVNYRKVRNPKGDRIVILEDTNHDGQADRSTVFYQGNDINAAMGMTVLGNKVIISNSPEIFILEDVDGDNVADRKEVLFSKLRGEQHDHSTHTVVQGPDGRFYFGVGDQNRGMYTANGLPISDIHGVDTLKVEKGKIFRFDGKGQKLEMLAHNFRNPYELCIDSYGNVFQSDNDNGGSPACRLNFLLDYGDYGYGGGPSYSGSRSNEHPRKEEAHWRQNDPGIVPNLVLTGNGAPTGVMVYEGSLLPKEMQGQIFLCGHAQNIVRVYQRRPKGAGFETSFVNLVRGNVSWFRPTDVCTAGDGSVFIADWHDPASGGHRALSSSTGRIYRVAPKGVGYQPVAQKVEDLESALKALESCNIETRNLAAQFLRESASINELKSLLNSENPLVRARALFVVAEKDEAEAILLNSFSDKNESVRIAILRAARGQGLEMSKLLKVASKDASAQVRREAALALKYAHDDSKLWANLARQYQPGDKMMLEALGVAADDRWDICLFELFKSPPKNEEAFLDILWRSNSIKALPYYVKRIKDPEVPFESSVKFFRAFDYYSISEREPYLRELLELSHPDENKIMAYALKHLKNPSTKDPIIAKAVNKLLEEARGTEAFVYLVKQYKMKEKLKDIWIIVKENKANPLGQNALGALVDLGGIKKFVEAYKSSEQKDEWINLMGASKNKRLHDYFTNELLKKETPLALKFKLLKAVCETTAPPRKVMAEILKGNYSKGEGYIETLEILAQCSAANVVDWAVVELTKLQGREPLSLNKLIAMDGDASQGKTVFDMACTSCHVVNDKGIDFGPNLTRIGSKLGRFAMFDALLNPSAGIEFNFETIEVTMNNGQVFTGLFAGDTTEDYKLKLPGGVVQTLDKSKIARQRKLGHSMMPAGIAKGMEPKQLAHLVTYLSSLN